MQRAYLGTRVAGISKTAAMSFGEKLQNLGQKAVAVATLYVIVDALLDATLVALDHPLDLYILFGRWGFVALTSTMAGSSALRERKKHAAKSHYVSPKFITDETLISRETLARIFVLGPNRIGVRAC